jgi:N-ethylmaleimide reductase
MGRAVNPAMPGRGQPVSASATTQPGEEHTYDGKMPHVEARPLRIDEIPGLLDDYRNATRNALAAGFDGVQIHSANGYLLDQFMRNGTNFRTDEYSGPIENSICLLGEATRAVAERVSVRLSPNGDCRGVNTAIRNACSWRPPGCCRISGLPSSTCASRVSTGTFGQADRPPIAPAMRKAFSGPFVLNTDLDQAKAQNALNQTASAR